MDLLLLPDFLDRDALGRIVGILQTLSAAPATVYGAAPDAIVQANVRKAMRVEVPDELRDELVRRFEAAMPRIAEHFGVALQRCEEPQVLHYREGDFFVAHQDGNIALTRDDTRHRRVSIVLFLNEQSAEPETGTYGGGDLLFHGSYPDWTARHAAPASAGALVAFRAETTHEVTPVTHGDRYTVVSFYR
jgi:SM-20-related protein